MEKDLLGDKRNPLLKRKGKGTRKEKKGRDVKGRHLP